MERKSGWSAEITPELVAFIGERDSLYFGTASADRQPYIQHRGGPKGFLKVLDNKTLALADPEYGASIERALVFHLEAWDSNCPQHITPRYTVEEISVSAGAGSIDLENGDS